MPSTLCFAWPLRWPIAPSTDDSKMKGGCMGLFVYVCEQSTHRRTGARTTALLYCCPHMFRRRGEKTRTRVKCGLTGRPEGEKCVQWQGWRATTHNHLPRGVRIPYLYACTRGECQAAIAYTHNATGFSSKSITSSSLQDLQLHSRLFISFFLPVCLHVCLFGLSACLSACLSVCFACTCLPVGVSEGM